jgi:hypothetical protein
MIIYQASRISHFVRITGLEVKPKNLVTKYSILSELWIRVFDSLYTLEIYKKIYQTLKV